jgi:hypothetical protein
MEKLLFLVAALLLVLGVVAHELCIDMSGPKNIQMDYCTAYNAGGKSCCNVTQDADIKSLMIHLAIPYDFTDCPALMHNLLCAQWYDLTPETSIFLLNSISFKRSMVCSSVRPRG